MNTFAVLADSILRRHQRLVYVLGLAAVGFALTALPDTRAGAYPIVSGPVGIGSINDYMRRAQPHDQGYAPPAPYRRAVGQGYYGATPRYHSQATASAEEAMVIALMVLEHYQERHQLREIRHHRRHSGWVGNPTQLLFANGY
jgi:hypothetical protein